ncbi:MAG: hypothetical protein JWO04_2579 [Gammaproteobacteria bacterium]|nr:hypothetical protein [Gammaproteobacteria bacterium]
MISALPAAPCGTLAASARSISSSDLFHIYGGKPALFEHGESDGLQLPEHELRALLSPLLNERGSRPFRLRFDRDRLSFPRS